MSLPWLVKLPGARHSRSGKWNLGPEGGRMRIMAVGAVHDHTTPSPTGEAFAVGATCPVSRLLKVALATETVYLVDIDGIPFQ